MKKQLFLLTSLLIASANFMVADSSCCKTTTSCKTSCKPKACKDVCLPAHGKTFRRVENAFQSATPVSAALFDSNVVRNLDADDKHGGMEITVFGGKNTKRAESACYFFPYGHSQYTFDGSVKEATAISAASVRLPVRSFEVLTDPAATNITGATGDLSTATTGRSTTGGANNFTFATLPSENAPDGGIFKFDTNKDTSKILPWNFGITFAALFEPVGNNGTGILTEPEFKSTVSPEYFYSHIGAGMKLRYHFSDDKQGFFGFMSTSVEHVRSRICLNEDVQAKKKELTNDNFATANPGALSNTVPSVRPAYINGADGTGFPVEETVTNNGGTPPANVEEAFAQDAWKYGKIGCEQRITRLADIELAVGYQWMCSDCASTSWYLGVVIPTGNKPCADYVAPAVVGNGQHGGIMMGSTLDLMLSENEDRAVWFRLDANSRYLFRNTQKRSFDLKGNEWSRYMMVWENKEAYEAGLTFANDTNGFGVSRMYTPGINVFTHDMKVKPRFQTRMNSALNMRSECLQAELGWNVLARTKECVEFSCPWTQKPAFADSSYVSGLGLNNNRTIYNDSQLTVGNMDDSNNNYAARSTADLTSTNFENYEITEDDVNLDSAGTPASITHTPYATVGYAWDSDCKPVVSVGAQYEFSAGNVALNKWMVWGKFEFAF